MSRATSARDLLGGAWAEPAAHGARGPTSRDVALALGLSVLAAVEGALRTDLSWPAATTAVTIALLACLPWRRSQPLAAVTALTGLSTGLAVVQQIAGVPQDGLAVMAALLAIPYALFRWGSGRDRIAGGSLLAVGTVISTALGEDGLAGAIAGVAIVGGTCAAAAVRRERVAARVREGEHARLREREALARDLHDTVAHHISAIAIRAQGAAGIAHDAGRVQESLRAIEDEARAVLGEMRALVRTLRDPAAYAPTAGMEDLARLASPGPPAVRVRIDAPADLPGVVAATLFRIAQEGITNARRHARDATAIDVAVTAQRAAVAITVRDDGGAPRPRSDAGHGLQGLAERAALLGGDLVAGPDPAGGWAIRASLPLGGAT